MAKISESKGSGGEGYVRLFGSEQAGFLFSKVQAAMIRSGFELEKLLEQILPPEMVTSLESLADESLEIASRPRIQVVFKPSRPDPNNSQKSIQADLLVVDNLSRQFKLIEVKEGYVFDTKKADGELVSLRSITSWLAQEFAYKTDYYLCSFNQDNKEAIVSGSKRRFSIEHVMTGRELCELIGLDYEYVRNLRKVDQEENKRYFLRNLLEIPEIRAEIIEILSEYDEE